MPLAFLHTVPLKSNQLISSEMPISVEAFPTANKKGELLLWLPESEQHFWDFFMLSPCTEEST